MRANVSGSYLDYLDGGLLDKYNNIYNHYIDKKETCWCFIWRNWIE